MTWAEFKTAVEKAGVQDHYEVDLWDSMVGCWLGWEDGEKIVINRCPCAKCHNVASIVLPLMEQWPEARS